MINHDYRGYRITYSEELDKDLIDVHDTSVVKLMEVLIDDYLSHSVSEYQLPYKEIYGNSKFIAYLIVDEERETASFQIVREKDMFPWQENK